MTAIVTRGNALDLHLPDACVDLIVTSPPYFGLRSYQDDGQHYAGQVGDEATPTEYLDALITATAEWVRVLKPGGSIWVNIGDRYSSGNSGQSGRAALGEQYRGGGHTQAKAKTRSDRVPGMPTKSLIGLPWRYAIRCIDELGLILRAEIVWSKPNGLPESVTDRVRRSHEQIFHFVKQPRYFSAVDEVREEHSPHTVRYYPPGGSGQPRGGDKTQRRAEGAWHADPGGKALTGSHPLGKLPGSVWTIPTSPLTVPESLGVDHFAAYPPELVRRIVLGWSPREVCAVCGEGRRPVTSVEREPGWTRGTVGSGGQRNPGEKVGQQVTMRALHTVIGYACACPDTTAPTTPGLVLDPFGGTGTTALVATMHGRVGISVDLSADYCRLAKWRTQDPGERARVLGVPKPEPVPEGQLDIFGELSG